VIDEQIYFLTYQRIQYAKHLQKLKPSIRDPVREVAIISRLQKKEKLEKTFVRDIWSLLFKQSYVIQEKELEKTQESETLEESEKIQVQESENLEEKGAKNLQD
jgi:chorismate mutase